MDNQLKHDEAETKVPRPAKQLDSITSEATQDHSVEVILREAPPGAVLLFDEGDTLFKKRSTVEDSHHHLDD